MTAENAREGVTPVTLINEHCGKETEHDFRAWFRSEAMTHSHSSDAKLKLPIFIIRQIRRYDEAITPDMASVATDRLAAGLKARILACHTTAQLRQIIHQLENPFHWPHLRADGALGDHYPHLITLITYQLTAMLCRDFPPQQSSAFEESTTRMDPLTLNMLLTLLIRDIRTFTSFTQHIYRVALQHPNLLHIQGCAINTETRQRFATVLAAIPERNDTADWKNRHGYLNARASVTLQGLLREHRNYQTDDSTFAAFMQTQFTENTPALTESASLFGSGMSFRQSGVDAGDFVDDQPQKTRPIGVLRRTIMPRLVYELCVCSTIRELNALRRTLSHYQLLDRPAALDNTRILTLEQKRDIKELLKSVSVMLARSEYLGDKTFEAQLQTISQLASLTTTPRLNEHRDVIHPLKTTTCRAIEAQVQFLTLCCLRTAFVATDDTTDTVSTLNRFVGGGCHDALASFFVRVIAGHPELRRAPALGAHTGLHNNLLTRKRQYDADRHAVQRITN